VEGHGDRRLQGHREHEVTSCLHGQVLFDGDLLAKGQLLF
jgi:hypothetical protein